ncbi:polysaccharide deacetylase family protein [Jiella avicenniae]|uniref:Chitooligosaccharide deacetylase n=1 Tax=Jiella avicenniae TaxID=2907202 RepID=A0A9X1P0Q0_9HYPH|nr:polysaccharide deacetylase family protein [Jiella avicenniae]MCE7027931.1 polysaccharide deacetylase family protein [Jiella avicenniae]
MRPSRVLLSAVLAASLLSGCARNDRTSMAFSAVPATGAASTLVGYQPAEVEKTFPLFQSFQPPVGSALSGRTIAVARYSDIALRDKEVVLTFDDGPMPGKTHTILKALSDYGVGATFLMVGQMAKAYPNIAREVAQAGHTIGTHTYRHANLRTMSDAAAMAEIRKGELSVADALKPIGMRPAPFFRFPYLADTQSLRHRLAGEGIVAIDVDVDSKDYFRDAPATVRERTLRTLDRHGRGIILMHDIQGRTAAMLPGFLAELEKRGYKVVRLVPEGQAQVAGL